MQPLQCLAQIRPIPSSFETLISDPRLQYKALRERFGEGIKGSCEIGSTTVDCAEVSWGLGLIVAGFHANYSILASWSIDDTATPDWVYIASNFRGYVCGVRFDFENLAKIPVLCNTQVDLPVRDRTNGRVLWKRGADGAPVILDLRDQSPIRAGGSEYMAGSIRVNLSSYDRPVSAIYLPDKSKPGSYDVRVLEVLRNMGTTAGEPEMRENSLMRTSGVAETQGKGVIVLKPNWPGRLTKGEYILQIRPATRFIGGGGWTSYSLTVEGV